MKSLINKILSNKLEFISVIMIFALAVILRIITLNNCGGMWGDEESSWYLASQSNLFKVLKETFNSDLHTPLYFIILHYWIQLFGDEIYSMRILSFVITLPLIPFAYCAGKKLFNRIAGYYAAILFTVNTFCIYYCIEIRMYALNILLSLFSAYFFVSYLNNFKKRSAICYIISITLLIYNFAMTPLLAFCYFMIGFIYLYNINPSKLKNFIIIQSVVLILSIPAIIWIILISIRIHNQALLSIVENIFPFKECIKQLPLTFLENFFSLENLQISTTYDIKYIDFVEKKNPIYFVTVFVPILIALSVFVRTFFSKNKNFYLMVLPSLLFFVLLILLSSLDLAALQVRYLTLIFPIITITLAYGFSLFKIKEISYSIFFLYIILMNFYLVFNYKESIYNIKRGATNGSTSIYIQSIGLKTDDLLLVPLGGYGQNYYIKHDNIILFYSDRMLHAAHKDYLKMYFGDEYKKYNRYNVKELLAPELFNNTPHKAFEENLYNMYIKNMKKGQRLIFADLPYLYVENMQNKLMAPITKYNYKNYNLSLFMLYKLHFDCYLVAKKYLKEIKKAQGVYAFEKE